MRYSRGFALMAIQHSHVPKCIECVHYCPLAHTPFESPLSHCKAVGTMNVVTGEITYVSAETSRRYDCNIQGNLYKPEPHLFLKKGLHQLKRAIPYVCISFLPLLLTYVMC